jgi:hypothetical protein
VVKVSSNFPCSVYPQRKLAMGHQLTKSAKYPHPFHKLILNSFKILETSFTDDTTVTENPEDRSDVQLKSALLEAAKDHKRFIE